MFKMAFRNIFRQKRRSFLTALTMFGGFLLAAVFLGFQDGSFNGLVNLFTRNRLGHIQIHRNGYLKSPTLNKAIAGFERIGAVLDRTSGVEAWAPRVHAAGLASVGERSTAAQIIGLDPEMENKATRFDQKVVQGRPFTAAAKEIILGKGLAKALKASIGDDVVVVSQGADGSLANERYRLIGLAETGDEQSDRATLYLHLDDARELFVLDERVHELVVIVRSLKSVSPLTAALRRELASFPVDVQPWPVFARAFYTAMEADRRGHRIILLVFFLVVAIGVLNTALMMVLERRREYGVLKALGTRPPQIFRLIILEMTLLALASIALGAGLGLPINMYLSRHGITLSEPFSFGGVQYATANSEVNLPSFIIPAVLVFLAAFLVSIFPAVKAARTDPAKSLRIY